MGRVKDYLLDGGEHLEVGMRVRVVDGLPSHWGQPLGIIRGIGPEMIRVELFSDESVHYFDPRQLRPRRAPDGPASQDEN